MASPCSSDTAQKIALAVPSGTKWMHAHHYLTQSGEADACHARCVCVGTTVREDEVPRVIASRLMVKKAKTTSCTVVFSRFRTL
jgi:hypothetical protein